VCFLASIPHTLRALQDVEKTVGQTIRKLRLKRSITQEQLADLAGINRTHMYRIENGHVQMTLGTLKLIADAMNLRIRELVRDA
jgi:transcriptional regulator with XRE-family HTH domain